jgi:hypothetical protein
MVLIMTGIMDTIKTLSILHTFMDEFFGSLLRSVISKSNDNMKKSVGESH